MKSYPRYFIPVIPVIPVFPITFYYFIDKNRRIRYKYIIDDRINDSFCSFEQITSTNDLREVSAEELALII